MKEMADGTIRVQIDIDPQCRAQFLQLFPDIDMPVALAPLVADFERKQERPKGGELARLAGQLCQNPDFQSFAAIHMCGEGLSMTENAAEWIRLTCGIESRAELDHNATAASKFHQLVRIPFVEYREAA